MTIKPGYIIKTTEGHSTYYLKQTLSGDFLKIKDMEFATVYETKETFLKKDDSLKPKQFQILKIEETVEIKIIEEEHYYNGELL